MTNACRNWVLMVMIYYISDECVMMKCVFNDDQEKYFDIRDFKLLMRCYDTSNCDHVVVPTMSLDEFQNIYDTYSCLGQNIKTSNDSYDHLVKLANQYNYFECTPMLEVLGNMIATLLNDNANIIHRMVDHNAYSRRYDDVYVYKH